MQWPWSRRADVPSNASVSITDPSVAALLVPGGLVDLAGVAVSERTSLGLSAFYRALMLISGTLASLPLNTWTGGKGSTDRKRMPSVFDDPDAPDGQTSYEWKETLFLHLLLHGRAGALKIKTQAGATVRLPLVHPISFNVVQPSLDEQDPKHPERMPAGGVWFDVRLDNGQQVRLDADSFWYVPGPSLGGQEGISLLSYARDSLATSIAGNRAAAKTFGSGALISGLATPADSDVDISDDIPAIRKELNRNVLGWENAGTIALVNRRLQFTPWTMTAEQAQFLQSRQFQIEEVARWTGVPPHLLMQTDKQTSWGTGVDEQNRGLSKFVLGHWAQRVEQRASRLLANPRWCEFDFAALERPNFATIVGLVLQQVKEGLISAKYGREVLGIPETAAPPAPEPAPAAPPPAADPQEGEPDDPPAE